METGVLNVRGAFMQSTKLVVKPVEVTHDQTIKLTRSRDKRLSKRYNGCPPYIKTKDYRHLSRFQKKSHTPRIGVSSFQSWREYQKSLKHIRDLDDRDGDTSNAKKGNAQCIEMDLNTGDDNAEAVQSRKGSCWIKCELQVYVCVYSTGANHILLF